MDWPRAGAAADLCRYCDDLGVVSGSGCGKCLAEHGANVGGTPVVECRLGFVGSATISVVVDSAAGAGTVVVSAAHLARIVGAVASTLVGCAVRIIGGADCVVTGGEPCFYLLPVLSIAEVPTGC